MGTLRKLTFAFSAKRHLCVLTATTHVQPVTVLIECIKVLNLVKEKKICPYKLIDKVENRKKNQNENVSQPSEVFLF